MMDIGISGAAPAAEPSVVVKSGRNGQDNGHGFNDALSQASGRDRNAAGDRRDSRAAGSDASASKAGAGRAEAGGRAVARAPHAAASATDANSQADDTASDASEDAAAEVATAIASDQAADAQPDAPTNAALAAMLASTALGENVADNAASTDGVSENADDGDKTEEPDDAVGAQATADVLTLLGAVTDPAPPAVMAAAAAGSASISGAKPAKDASQAAPSGKTSDGLSVLAQQANSGKPSDSLGSVAAPAANTDEADASDTALPTVKVARADGSGRVFDLSLSRGHDDSLDVEAKTSNAGNIDVTVLDQRRYLGLAAGTNSATILGTLGGNGEWTSAMSPSSELSNQALWTSTGKVVNTLKIQLHPQDLGTVTATMRLSGDELSIDLKVHTGEAYRQLSSDQSHILDALRSQGYTVDRVTVSMAASDSNDANAGSGFQGQQQATANQNQGGEAQSRRQGYSGQQASGNEGNWSVGDAETNDGAGGANRRGRAGGVYL